MPEPDRRTAIFSVSYLSLTALLILLGGRAIHNWGLLVAAHLAIGAALLAIAYRDPLPRLLVALRDWHPLVLFPLLYKEVELLAAAIGDWRLTAVIPRLEEALFNGQPSIYLSERLTSVAFSEFLHLCYFAYIVVIPAVAAHWYVRDREAFHELVLLLAVTMFGSYLFFILYPVDSPFYRFERLGPPFAGHFFFDLVHHVSSRGGARGGAFPSAHVSGAVIVWLIAWRHERPLAMLLSPLILGVIVATVYGRFHYVLDSVAGCALALIVVTFYERWLECRLDGPRFP